MPFLDQETRARVAKGLAERERIRQSFVGRSFVSVHCYLCQWASNGLTYEEAESANRVHVWLHPEDALMRAMPIGIRDLQRSLHDHECEMIHCTCICGCQDGPFCNVMGSLCATCLIRDGRGDKEHSKKEAPNALSD